MSRKVFNHDNFEESKEVSEGGLLQQFTNTISACGCLFMNNDKVIWSLMLSKIWHIDWN